MLTVTAPAKLNLTLEILGRRPDGYHEVRSVLQTISLADRLTFQPHREVSFRGNRAEWSAGESLAAQAVKKLQSVAGKTPGVLITIEKNIPLLAGLGGDSSAAAAVLRGLNELWGLHLPEAKLYEIAGRLGADVPFFLHGGTMLAAGRGEVLTPLPPPPPFNIVLAVPDTPREPGKTGRMYARLTPAQYTGGEHTARLAAVLREGREFTPGLLFNAFDGVAFKEIPGVKALRGRLLAMGALHVHLAGSGPALFTLLKDKAQAEGLYVKLQAQGIEAYLVGKYSKNSELYT